MSDDAAQHRTRTGTSAAAVRSRVVGVLVAVIRLIGAVAAVVLVAHVILTVGEANPENGITEFVGRWADRFALGFRDLFTPEERKTAVLVNYGLAAVSWLVVSAIVARIVRRLG